MLLDDRDRVLLQHGGVATRIDWDRVEDMPLGMFLEREVPKLKEQADGDSLYVLRNSVAGAYTFILGDRVVKYHAKDVTEVPLRELKAHLSTDEEEVDETRKVYAWDIPFQLVCRVETARDIHDTVYVPSRHCRYRCSMLDIDAQVWLPPLWFRVDMTKAYGTMSAAVAVVPETSPTYLDTQLKQWPLANVFGDCKICFGGTRSSGVEVRTEGQAISATLSRFIDSDWNLDVIPGGLERICTEAYNALPQNFKQYERQICSDSNNSTVKGVYMAISIMSMQGGWAGIHYNNAMDAGRFTWSQS